MNKVITAQEAQTISHKLSAIGKKIVLAGGCFDILHKGHVAFLKAAREKGDVLFLLLESDSAITAYKGALRPIHTQAVRSKVLAALPFVDYIILLQDQLSNNDYDKVISGIKPAIIATTRGDTHIAHKIRQAKQVGGEVIEVIERLPEHSTTDLLRRISI